MLLTLETKCTYIKNKGLYQLYLIKVYIKSFICQAMQKHALKRKKVYFQVINNAMLVDFQSITVNAALSVLFLLHRRTH